MDYYDFTEFLVMGDQLKDVPFEIIKSHDDHFLKASTPLAALHAHLNAVDKLKESKPNNAAVISLLTLKYGSRHTFPFLNT